MMVICWVSLILTNFQTAIQSTVYMRSQESSVELNPSTDNS